MKQPLTNRPIAPAPAPVASHLPTQHVTMAAGAQIVAPPGAAPNLLTKLPTGKTILNFISLFVRLPLYVFKEDLSTMFMVIPFLIVDVRVAYIKKLAFLGDRDHLVTANFNRVYCSYLQGPLDHSSLLPGLKLELPIFTMALPVPGHERVNP